MKEKKNALNGIRGVMAVAILLSHCGYLKYYSNTEGIYTYIYCLYGAVTFFFVLSGYFFGYTERAETFISFITRRIKKIYPLHILTLGISAGILLVRGSFLLKERMPSFFANLFLIHSWIPREEYYFSFNAVSWFLSTLLACYVLCFFFHKHNIFFKMMIIILYILQIFLCLRLQETEHWMLYVNPFFRIADFGVGYYLSKNKYASISIDMETKWIYTLGEISAILMFGVAVYIARWLPVNWTYNCLFVIPTISIIWIFSFEQGMVSRILKCKFFQFLGICSLELFMTHKFIVNNITNIAPFIKLAIWNPYISLIFILISCFILAGITHKIIERMNSIWIKG